MIYEGAKVKRSRRGGRRPQNGHSGHNPHNGGGGGGNNLNRTFDSTGPEVKVRGPAAHVYEKYLQLARDANASGDRIMAESYLQHAEHYFRILSAAQAQAQQYQQSQQSQSGNNANGNVYGTGQPYRPPGSGEQPNVQQPSTTGGPAFSLTDTGNATEGDDGDEAENSEQRP